MTRPEFVGPLRHGAALIGRNGTKLHPVTEIVHIRDDGSEIKILTFHCSCTGTANGRAHNTAQVFWNHHHNCRT